MESATISFEDIEILDLDAELINSLKEYLFYINKKELRNLTSEEVKYITYNKGKWPPNNYVEWMLFVKEKRCPTNLDFYIQVFEDFERFYMIVNGTWSSIVTQEMLEKPFKHKHILRIKIKNHRILSQQGLTPSLGIHLNRIMHLLPKNLEFPYNYFNDDTNLPADDGNGTKPYLNPNDTLERNECIRKTYNNNQKTLTPGTVAYTQGTFVAPPAFITTSELFPVLSQGKRDCHTDLIFPMPSSLKLAVDKVKWENKVQKVVWRGSNTGTWITSNSLHKLSHRYRLVDWAINQTDYIKENLEIEVDVGFYRIHQCDNNTCEQAKNETLMVKELSYDEQFKSKYLIVVDGNSWPFRLSNFLSTNSLVLYNGIYKFWFSRHIKPYVHYLPFKSDFSDLTQQLEYAKNHDQEMKQISQNAKKFIREFISGNNLSCYLGLLMIEYVELVKHLN